MKRFRFNSLRSKFVLICVLLLVIPSAVIGTVGYQNSKRHLDKAGEIQLKSSVRLAIGMIRNMDIEVKAGRLSLEEAQEIIRKEILGPKDADNKRPINEKYIIGQTGYLYAVDQKAVSVMNPANEGSDMTKVTTKDGVQMGETILRLAASGGGYYTYMWDNPLTGKEETKISYVETDPSWGWIVGSGAYSSEFNQGANEVLRILLVTLGIALLLGGIIVWLFSASITRPILVLAEHIRKVAGGDLTVKPLVFRNQDEVGRLVIDFNAMTSNLRELVRHVADSSEQVAASSEQLSAGAGQTSQATEQIAVSSQEVAVGAEKQAKIASDTNEMVNEISKGMEQVAYSIQSVADDAAAANEDTAKGNEVVKQTTEQMNVVYDRVETTARVIHALGDKSNEIGQVVSLIAGVANQTNLLALNASIEAARAGEHGKGFAVVANEVRKLAEQAGNATENIAAIIKDIQTDIRQAISVIGEGTAAVEEGMRNVHQSGESFRAITKRIAEVSAQSQEVSAIIEEVSASTQAMVKSIESVVQISEQAAGSSQSMAAASEEQLASMEEITSSATALALMAEELQTVIRKFRV